jgi:major membrane immunogen (membrane-anchored lipoprotein)
MSWSKRTASILFLVLLFGLSGCSSSDSKNESAKMSTADKGVMDSVQSGKGEGSLTSFDPKKETSIDAVKGQTNNQKVIYQADLELRVKNYEQTMQRLEEKAKKYGGYIAESNVTKNGAEQVSGSLKLRIPQEHFQDFINNAEGQAVEVLQRNINGQDVTEEYVDLESRLKSKKAVEERLLSFMKSAAKTEDLLKISADLATVQEEIEVIEGRMKYLENQTSFSTVNITLYERKVVVPNLEKGQLNTWEKTKKQFMKSTNLLLAALSGLIVFILGNLPILIIFVLLGFLGYLYYKKKKSQNKRE